MSITDDDVPLLSRHRQVTDAHLLTLARRHGTRVLTFDQSLNRLAHGRDAEMLALL